MLPSFSKKYTFSFFEGFDDTYDSAAEESDHEGVEEGNTSIATPCQSCENYEDSLQKLKDKVLRMCERETTQQQKHEQEITVLEGRVKQERERCEKMEEELHLARKTMEAQREEIVKLKNNDKGKGPVVVESLNMIATG